MNTTASGLPQGRWTALDVLRGITIAAMILVNRPGDWSNLYAPLAHAEWHGATPTDFIFPFFLFIVGVSIALSFTRQLEKAVLPSQMYPKIAGRTLKLFLFGVVMGFLIYLAGWFDFRFTGVLQRIAVVFLVCSLLFLNSGWRTQLVLLLLILAGYWAFMAYVPVPGTGSTGFEWEDNWVSWFDRHYMPGALYMTVHDPEGILSTLPAIGTGITGLLAGHIYVRNKSMASVLRNYLWVGLLMIASGYAWSFAFPLNKNLWSSSFVLFTSGWATLFLALLTWLIDVKQWKWATRPWLVFGSNAITVYLLSFLLVFPFSLPLLPGGASLQGWILQGVRELPLNPKQVSLLWALFNLYLCYIPMNYLYRKKIFWKV